MNVAEIMSRKLVALRDDASLLQAVRLMTEHHISGLPVLDADARPVGILTDGDLLRRAEIGTDGDKPGPFRTFFTPDRLAGDYVRTHGRRVSELMTAPVIVVADTASLGEVAESMRKHRVKRLPVCRAGVVVGVVSRGDLVAALFQALDIPTELGEDADIRKQIGQELDRHEFLTHRAITIGVTRTRVTLDGVVFDMRQRDAAQVVAENLSGTRTVENHLVVVSAASGMIAFDPACQSL